MFSLHLKIQYGAYPLWIHSEEDGGVIETALPDEWKDDSELSNILHDIQEQYEALYNNDGEEFSFVGFKNKDEHAAFVKLAEEAVKRVYDKNNGKYPIRNSIDSEFYEGLYTGE